MVVLFTRPPMLSARIRPLLSEARCLRAADWHDVVTLGVVASAVVVAVNNLAADDAREALRMVARSCPLTPIVLVTRAEPENLVELRGLNVRHVVFLRSVEEDLPAVIRSATGFGAMDQLAERLLDASHLPPALRSALASACKADPPVRTVARLAMMGGCSRTTLWRQWHASLPGLSVSPHDFLRWLMIVRFAERCRTECSARAAAATVGADLRTIRAAAGDLVGSDSDRWIVDLVANAWWSFQHHVAGPMIERARRPTS